MRWRYPAVRVLHRFAVPDSLLGSLRWHLPRNGTFQRVKHLVPGLTGLDVRLHVQWYRAWNIASMARKRIVLSLIPDPERDSKIFCRRLTASDVLRVTFVFARCKFHSDVIATGGGTPDSHKSAVGDYGTSASSKKATFYHFHLQEEEPDVIPLNCDVSRLNSAASSAHRAGFTRFM